ncbi:unnamed protein product [Larinioides sclopetarius]|uniref:glutathione transferase n=1 Tax=Larinioides sclopetarius TaxID=280406 RepID=A0AAV1ZTK3_9ARAC
MAKPILRYWDLRFLAEPIRYLLHYKKVDFEDRRSSYDKVAWQVEKIDLGLDFPMLPYYMDEDVKLSQSIAILRYLARKYDLDGKDEKQKLRVFLAEQQIVDMSWNLVFLVVSKDYNESTRADFIKKIPDMLKLWENFIGDQKYLTGDDITYVDFMAYEAFDFYRLFHSEALDNFPKLKAFLNRIKNLPELQEYLNSYTYRKWPILGPSAKFGSGGDPPKHL